SSARTVFSGSFTIGGVNIRTSVIYWLVVMIIATYILMRTRVGNWIFAVGGHAPSARAVGVPVGKMKIGLFMTVGFMAWFTGMHTLFLFNTIQYSQGVGNDFVYIIAAVVGALIFGMVNQGIVYAGWNPDWFQFFVGLLLLGAILLNTYIRRRAEAA